MSEYTGKTIDQLVEITDPEGVDWLLGAKNGIGRARKISIANAILQGAQGDPGADGADGADANITFVNHGGDPNTARPAGYTAVVWYGSVQPNNAVAPDIVIRTDESV
jgi:hypothetical protein